MISYPDSVDYLYKLGNEIRTSKLGLDRISAVLAAMDHPERAFESVHVAGTNGKGSTCAMIEAALRATGARTGLYTSPHLVEPTERIRIDGVQVTREQFADAFHHVHGVAARLLDSGEIDTHPTYFETVTAMAFHLFREARVERAVVEVGLGGRLDATNAIKPRLAVITPVDYDHEAWLGSTLDSIASEKAGIIKAGVPVVIARQNAEALRRILATASERGAPLVSEESAVAENVDLAAYGSEFTLDSARFRVALAGEHQIGNAITAILALRQLGVAEDAIRDGIARVTWPGRLERVARRPDIVLDGAHNPSGARALAAYIRRFHANRRVWLVYGAMRDKAIEEIADLLASVASEVILTAPDSPRALRPDAVAPLFDHPRARVAPDLDHALAIVRAEAAPEDIVFITGSLFLVGEARPRFVE